MVKKIEQLPSVVAHACESQAKAVGWQAERLPGLYKTLSQKQQQKKLEQLASQFGSGRAGRPHRLAEGLG